jgi:hypothetical protein
MSLTSDIFFNFMFSNKGLLRNMSKDVAGKFLHMNSELVAITE